MGLGIKYLTGELHSKSFWSNSVVIKADEEVAFGISGLKDFNPDVDKVSWVLKDKKKTRVIDDTKKEVPWDQKYVIQIDKKLSGIYTYLLTAEYKNGKTGHKTSAGSIYIRSFCEPQILSYTCPTDINTGDSILNISLVAEGVNGNMLILEIYNKKTKRKIYQSGKVECIEDKIKFNIEGTKTVSWVPSVKGEKLEEGAKAELYIKVKDSATKKYILDSSKKEDIIELTVTKKNQKAQTLSPENKTNLMLRSTTAAHNPVSDVNGIIELMNLKVKNSLTVYNDAYNGSGEDEWILAGGYHWLKTRTGVDKDKKPTEMPVTFAASEPIRLDVNYKCLFKIKDFHLRVKEHKNYRKFKDRTEAAKSPGDEFPKTFEADPFNKVRYIPDFQLKFEYSFDRKFWVPINKVPLCLYVTKATPTGLTQVRETLLYIGCAQCDGMSMNASDEKIVDQIFKKFKTKKVGRRREKEKRPDSTDYYKKHFTTEGTMGYWRGLSRYGFENTSRIQYFCDMPLTPTGINPAATYEQRTANILLEYGEARCGEWGNFFLDVLKTQNINTGTGEAAICTVDAGMYSIQSKNPVSGATSIVFAVKKAKHIDTDRSNPNRIKGYSKGQGTDNANPEFIDHFWSKYNNRFFDPSYGVSYSKSNSKYKKYCKDNISTIIVREHSTSNLKIETKNIYNYMRSNDPNFNLE